MTKLNIGSGERKLPGFINIDCEELTKPDVVCDVTKESLPFEPNSVDEVYCIHNLEHIEIVFWAHVLTEFRRVLKSGGLLVLMYPEFEVCAKFFIENKQGMRDFWRATLYGRQLYPGDYHVTPMVSAEVANHLRQCGFHNVKWAPEDEQPQYTIMRAIKGMHVTKENVIRKEVFGLGLEIPSHR